MSSVAARQALLAAYLDDPILETWVRRNPRLAAERYGVSAAFAQWLATLPAERVRQFRRSRAHKERLREGEAPSLLDDSPCPTDE